MVEGGEVEVILEHSDPSKQGRPCWALSSHRAAKHKGLLREDRGDLEGWKKAGLAPNQVHSLLILLNLRIPDIECLLSPGVQQGEGAGEGVGRRSSQDSKS